MKKIVLGITGSFGSGKSTVASILKGLGAGVIDADKTAHKLIMRGNPAYKKIVLLFGQGILNKNKEIDRRKLGERVFSDRSLLRRLNSIVHPYVIKAMRRAIAESPKRVVVLDVPLLIEANLARLAGKMIVVTASQEKQVERLRAKMNLSRQDIIKRIHMQMPLSDKVRMADFVIDNNGTILQTKKQIEQIGGMLWKN